MNIVEKIHRRGVQQRRAHVLAKHLAAHLPPDSPVLDIGCGDGHIAKIIQDLRPDTKITGTDILVRDSALVDVVPFDGKTLPFASSSMQAVMLVDVLHHASDIEALLNESARVCKGKVLIKDHLNESRIDEETLKFMDNVGNHEFGVSLPYNYLSKKKWNDLFSRLNLTVEYWESKLGLYPPPLNFVFDRSLHFICVLQVNPNRPL